MFLIEWFANCDYYYAQFHYIVFSYNITAECPPVRYVARATLQEAAPNCIGILKRVSLMRTGQQDDRILAMTRATRFY